ncbi:MAG: site-specific integrase [Geobacteraceae bacterium]|nr:site-specific integrase [Geobacteraceae bacterium]
MAYLKKRGNFWSIKYRDENNVLQTKALNTDSEQIAKGKLGDFEKLGPAAIIKTGGLSGAAGVPAATKTPLETAVQGFVEHIKTHLNSENGVKNVSVLRSIFGELCPGLEFARVGSRKYVDQNRPLLSAVHLQDLTTAKVQDYLQKILQVKDKNGRVLRGYVGKKTRNRYRETLHLFFEYALTPGRYSMSGENPVKKIKYLKLDKLEVRFLKIAAINKQLACLAEYPLLQVMVAVYIFAGLRRDEALWLTHDDIDLERGLIDVHGKTIDRKHWEPKNGENRQVRINTRLRSYLEQYKPASSEHGWFFPNPAGGRWDRDAFSEHLRKVNLEKLQFPELKANPALEMAVAIYLYSTLDWCDIVALTNKDVDLQKKVIRAKKKYTWNIPINDKLLPFIEAYCAFGDEDAPLIKDSKGNAWEEDDLDDELHKVYREKEVDWSCDEYRHTYGTQLAINNVSTRKIAMLMGNSEEIVIKHYAKFTPKDIPDNLDF